MPSAIDAMDIDQLFKEQDITREQWDSVVAIIDGFLGVKSSTAVPLSYTLKQIRTPKKMIQQKAAVRFLKTCVGFQFKRRTNKHPDRTLIWKSCKGKKAAAAKKTSGPTKSRRHA
jgi:hypothetical protein